MTAEINTSPVTEFEFTLEERWAIHQAIFDYMVAVRADTDLPQLSVKLLLLERSRMGRSRSPRSS